MRRDGSMMFMRTIDRLTILTIFGIALLAGCGAAHNEDRAIP